MNRPAWWRFPPLLERSDLPATDVLSAMGAATRSVLDRDESRSSRSRPIYEIGAAVAGPILASYVLWVFREARQNDIKRIYWISRDGEILLEIANSLQEKLGFDFENRYLHGSRAAWHLPAIANVPLDSVPWIVEDAEYLSVTQVLDRVGVEAADYQETIRECGIPSLSEPLGELALRLPRVLSDPKIHEAVLRAVEARRPLMDDYLVQEGLTDGTPSILVDVGWRGQLAAALERALERMGADSPLCLYVGLIPGATKRPKRHDSWLFDSQPEGGPLSMVGIFEIFETFCAGSHGLVDGYARQADRVIPTMKTQRNVAPLTWGLEMYRGGVRSFVEELQLPDSLDVFADARTACANLLEMFWTNPTFEEARSWGRFPTDVDQGGVVQRPLAGPYAVGHAFRKGLLGPRRVRTQTYWIGGTKASASRIAHAAFWIGRRLRKLVKRTPGMNRRSRTQGSARPDF